MNEFKYPYTKLLKALIYAALVLCAVGFFVNLWRFFNVGVKSNIDYIQYATLLIVTILFPVILIAMLVSSKYIVTETELIAQFGILKSRYKLDNVKSVAYPKEGNKLTVTMKDGSYMLLVLEEDKMNDFVAALRAKHPKIEAELYREEDPKK